MLTVQSTVRAIAPKVLIKIVLFGYSRGMISSRSLERAYFENITFMALACWQKPDQQTETESGSH
ncbi:MAG: transposase [Desulfobacterales bacterium]|nr:transposase [Desulfobacterales bacterium]